MESSDKSQQLCSDAIKIVATNRGFFDFEIDSRSGSAKGDNFLGNIYQVAIREKNNSKQILDLVVKMASKNFRDEIPIQMFFAREICAYEEVFKVFKDIQNKFKLGVTTEFRFVDCYYTSEKNMSELLILENLQTQGFELLGRNNRVEFEHVALVLSALAKFHAFSFVLRDQDTSKFNFLASKVPDFMAELPSFIKYLTKSINMAIACVENPLYNDKLIQLKDTFKDILKNSLEVDDYSIICHGDIWINNTMFKNKDGNPVDVRLVDYQMLHYAPAASDITYFLLSSTNGEFRRSHYSRCLDHYYNSLSVALQHFHYDVDDIFPRDEFDKQIKKCALYGLVVGICFSPIMVMDSENALDMTDIIDPEQSAPKGKALDVYLERVTGLLQTCIDFGYL